MVRYYFSFSPIRVNARMLNLIIQESSFALGSRTFHSIYGLVQYLEVLLEHFVIKCNRSPQVLSRLLLKGRERILPLMEANSLSLCDYS